MFRSNMDPLQDFLFPAPMTDEELEELAKLQQRRAVCEQREALKHLAELRQHVGDPLGSLDVTVLRPLCGDCIGRLSGHSLDGNQLADRNREVIVLHPEEVDGCVRLYDPGGKQLHIYDQGKPFQYRTRCMICRDSVDVSANDYVFAVPEPYTSYFELPETGPRHAPQWVRRALLEWYGEKCFMCAMALNNQNMTVDHIVPKSAQGSLDFSNLQPLCKQCNNERKGDEEGPLYRVYLDFLFRPAPSDSYEGLIW